MSRRTIVAALGLVLLGPAVANPEVAAAADARARGLGADDACGMEAGDASGSCAVSALQRGSARSLEKDTGGEDAPRSQSGADDESWVWSKEIIDTQMRADRWNGDAFMQALTDTFAPRMVQHCLRYNAFFWPQLSFWSEEVLRRVEAVPEGLDVQTQQQLQDFSRNASFLMCDFWFDPRKGTNWSEPVVEYMQKVRAMPNTSLELPMLDGWFERSASRDGMWSGDSCMFWASSLMCDIGQLARDLRGNKDHGDGLCWDQVQSPPNGFSVFGVSMQAERPAVKESDADFEHPEYLACQEKPLTKDLLMEYCPMFGHYPSGYMNVTHWGTAFAVGSTQRAQSLTCQKKLGIPESSPTTFGDVTHKAWRAENGGVKLMSDPPADYVPENFFSMEDSSARTAFTHAVRDAVLPVLTPNCDPNDWLCIVKTLGQEGQASAAKSGKTVEGPSAKEILAMKKKMDDASSEE